jgi:hypothetical protein
MRQTRDPGVDGGAERKSGDKRDKVRITINRRSLEKCLDLGNNVYLGSRALHAQ